MFLSRQLMFFIYDIIIIKFSNYSKILEGKKLTNNEEKGSYQNLWWIKKRFKTKKKKLASHNILYLPLDRSRPMIDLII